MKRLKRYTCPRCGVKSRIERGAIRCKECKKYYNSNYDEIDAGFEQIKKLENNLANIKAVKEL